MKIKLFLFYLISFLIGTGVFAQASPLITNPGGQNTVDAGGTSYTVIDRDKGTYGNWTTNYNGFSGFNGYIDKSGDSITFTGLYIGTIKGNDGNGADLANLAQYFLNDLYPVGSLSFKVDAPNQSDGLLTVTYASGNKSGTWSTVASNPPVSVDFYSVKGSNEYALYFVNPALQEGNWITNHLLNNGGQIPSISHLSVLIRDTQPPDTAVPEPATMVLLGFGMLGIAGFQRKLLKK